MRQILAGGATPAQIAGFVMALRTKGETVDEIAGLAETMLDFATPLEIGGHAVDVVGSGGDRANTVNISTMAAIVAAGAGARVVKHGNRAASSASGAADVLEALGVVLDVVPEDQQQVVDAAGIAFLFAPLYHPALRHAGLVRRELGVATVFNFLGPLANPAQPAAQAVGVADLRVAELVAGVLARRGHQGLVVHGGDGLDELTTTSASTVWVHRDGSVVRTTFDPLDLGIARAVPDDLVGRRPAAQRRRDARPARRPPGSRARRRAAQRGGRAGRVRGPRRRRTSPPSSPASSTSPARPSTAGRPPAPSTPGSRPPTRRAPRAASTPRDRGVGAA